MKKKIITFISVFACVLSLTLFTTSAEASTEDYNKGYEDGIKYATELSKLKSTLGPLYDGYYFGWVDYDSTCVSSMGYFNTEYQDFLTGNGLLLDHFIQSIASDTGGEFIETDKVAVDMIFVLGSSIKASNLDFSVRGVNRVILYCEDNQNITFNFEDYRSLNNVITNLNYVVTEIHLTIADYSDFVNCDGVMIVHGYERLYFEGYENGYEQGYDSGSHEGYDNGYDTGYDDGYNVGYHAGVNEANPVTLKSLFWTIAATPFEVFKHIWNFEFLGFNIAKFFTGLLMSIIAIFIIKKVIL